mgnify:CR=1 FL=1
MEDLPLMENKQGVSYKLLKAKMEITDARSFIEFQENKIEKIKSALADELTPSWYTEPCFVKIEYMKLDYGYDKRGHIDVVKGLKWFDRETEVVYLYGFRVIEEEPRNIRFVPKIKHVTINIVSGERTIGAVDNSLEEKNTEIISITKLN